MESNMKKVFQYMTTLLLLLVVVEQVVKKAMITGESLLMLNRELISQVMLRFIVLRLHRPNWWLHRWMELRKVQM